MMDSKMGDNIKITDRKQIILYFDDDDGTVVWRSVGWGDDTEAMTAAKKAINDGEHAYEVIELLEQAGFDVISL